MAYNSINQLPEFIKNYKIEKETYNLSKDILYTAINIDINEKVLIHIFPKEKIKTTVNEVTFMNNHVFLMKLLNHKNILKLYEIIETKTHAFLIYEYFNGVKLSDYIMKKKKLNEEETMIIFKQILSTLIYIHGMYLCNLNLSSNNIIIDLNNNIKICDFKYGHFYTTKEKTKPELIGDHPFLCPELHSKKQYNPELADMWSCGVILYQMITGNLPFKSKKDLDLIRSIIVGNYSIPNNINSNIKNLIKGLLEKNEEKRFKINDLFNQQYFKDKKIKKDSLGQGLNILSIKYPIDESILNICKNNFGIDASAIIKNLENNKFTPLTSLFKQIVDKFTSKGIKTQNDLISDRFLSYVNDHNNYLEEEEQINNIQNFLKKEEDIRKNAKDVAAILLNNQNEISKGLEDLKKQFENAKKGVKTSKRQKSVDYEKQKRRTFQFDNDKEILMKKMNKNNGINSSINNSSMKKKNINIKPVKRNTLFVSDIRGFKFSQKKKNSLKKEGFPKFNKSGNKFSSPNKDNKNKKEIKKVIEEIKEEDEKEKEEKNKEKDINESKSENSIENEYQNLNNKEEKKDENETPQKESVEKAVIQKEDQLKKAKDNSTVKKSNKFENKTINPMLGVKLNKIIVNQCVTEKKPKQQILHNQHNDMNIINKKLENNDKKIKLNLKKEEIEREKNIMKIKNELKKGSNNKSSIEIGKNSILNKKGNEPKVQGFKNIKEMIESNLKKQRVMSGENIRADKNKVIGKK